MKVALITIGYNLPGATTGLIDSALAGATHDLEFILFLHSQMPEKVLEMEQLAKRPDVIYHAYGFNRGLAKSWNEGILLAYERGCKTALVVNEDIVLGAGDVDRLAKMAEANPNCFMVTGRAQHGKGCADGNSEYACFALNPIAIETLGCFDENIFPIYYEDCDYRYRAKLAGLKGMHCAETNIRHGGSRSLQQPAVAAQNQITWSLNRAYFNRKWGGDPGRETFQRPFNDPRFTFYIDPHLRSSPYSGFNRADQDVVRI